MSTNLLATSKDQNPLPTRRGKKSYSMENFCGVLAKLNTSLFRQYVPVLIRYRGCLSAEAERESISAEADFSLNASMRPSGPVSMVPYSRASSRRVTAMVAAALRDT